MPQRMRRLDIVARTLPLVAGLALAGGVDARASVEAGDAAAGGHRTELSSEDVRVQPIMPLGAAGPSLGDAQLHTRSAGSDVVVTMTAPSVALQPGAEFRVVSCAQTHVLGAAPSAQCRQHDVDTRQASDVTTVAAPVATRQIAAPPPSQTGWASGMVEVLRRTSSGAWERAASSWTAGALATTAQPLTEAGLPQPLEAQGVAVDGLTDGGINSGARDSLCAPVADAAGQPLPDGVTSGALGAQGPAYSETGAPLTADGEARGVVLLLHGGGWTLTGPWAATGMRADADRWRARGWQTVNASYAACGDALEDVVAFVDHIRARIPDGKPLCIVGTSAGAHLALLAAARRPGVVDCVVSQSGPTDLASLAVEQAHDPFTDGSWATGPRAVHNLAVAAFGAENLTGMSPAHQAIRARMLVAIGEQDWLLAPSQATAFANAQRALDAGSRVQSLVLEPGAVAWGHGTVSQAAIDLFQTAEAELAEAAIADRQPPPESPPPATPAPGPTAPTAPTAAVPLAAPPMAGLPASILPRPVAPTARLALSTPTRAGGGRLAAGGALRVRVRASRAGRLSVMVRMHGAIVARAKRTVAGGASAGVALRLDRRSRARLRRARRLPRLRVTATLRDRRGRTLSTSSRTIQVVR